MLFKDDSLKDELAHTPVLLQTMAEWFSQLCGAHFGINPVVTRVFEAVLGSSGVHEAHRAVDFRDEHAGTSVFSPSQVSFLVSEMNRRFPRTDSKPTCLHHSFCGGPYHFHIQVSSGTSDVGELDCHGVKS